MLRLLLSPERTPVFIKYEAGWTPRASLGVSERRKISCPHSGFQTPDRPTLSLVCYEIANLHIHTHTHTHTHFCNEESFNPLTPNDPYRGRTAPLTSKSCILYIYSTNIGTKYFKHGIYSPFFSLQNAVCFIILTYLVPVLFAFYIQVC